MELDVEDVLVGAVSSMLGRLVLFGIALLSACVPVGGGLVAGRMVDEMGYSSRMLEFLPFLPLCVIFNSWAILNIPFLLIYLIRFARSEGDGYVEFGIVMGVESLVVMSAGIWGSEWGWMSMVAAWMAWLFLLIMLATGIWLIRQYFMNRWAQQLGMLRAENAQRNAERNSHRQIQADDEESNERGNDGAL